MKGIKWTRSQLKYLFDHYGTDTAEEISAVVGHSVSSIHSKAYKLGFKKSPEFLRECGRRVSELASSKARRFPKGHVPANKGKRIYEYMDADSIERNEATRFKLGHRTLNGKPIGYECVRSDGYVYVKASCYGKMVKKHRWVWEEAHGRIPEGMCVAFRDGDKMNCSLKNLYLISRKELALKRLGRESPTERIARLEKARETRNKGIRRDRVRIHWGLEPKGKLVKRW